MLRQIIGYKLDKHMLKRYIGKMHSECIVLFLIYQLLTQSPKIISYSVIILGVLPEVKKRLSDKIF